MSTEEEVEKQSKFRWQKELKENRHLPYYDQVIVEADVQFATIKSGLAYSMLLREVKPSLLHWLIELDKYIHLHGRRFTKSDHILLIKFCYEIVTMKNLEFRMVKTGCRLLQILLQKRELISRDDLVLNWRPMYDLYVYVAYKHLEDDGLLLLPQNMAQSLENVIKGCRTYFSDDSTQEILDEIRQYMCPWDMTFLAAAQCMSLFLPTTLPPDKAHKGYKLWLDEVIYWIMHVQNSPPWEFHFSHLLARLAKDNCGYIDWEPYMPMFFTKIIRGLQLQIGKGDYSLEICVNGKVIDVEGTTVLLANTLGANSSVQRRICDLFGALESYFHPSNIGRWTDKLLNFIQRLALAVCQRVHKERHRKPDWQTPTNEAFSLTDADLEAFVKSLLPCALSAMYSKHRADLAVNLIRCLAQLSPQVVIEPLMEKLEDSLETLIEPHRLIQTMNCLVGVIMPLTKLPEYQHHVIPVMIRLLPGIDSNDIGKTMCTFQALSLFAVLVPIVDCSDAVHFRDDLTEKERELCSATANFEDFVVQFLDKIFSMVENAANSHVHASSTRARLLQMKFSPEEQLMKSGMYATMRGIMGNCSTGIFTVDIPYLSKTG